MDRLTRTVAGFGLALLAASGGCKTAHDEVPPGKVYRPEDRPGAGGGVGFSTTPADRRPGSFGAPPNLTQGNLAGGGLMGSQPPGGDLTGTVPSSRFGAPGTSGAATPPGPASMDPIPPTGAMGSGLGRPPGLGSPSNAPAPTPRDDPGYLNGIPTQAPPVGAMGSPGAPMSPF